MTPTNTPSKIILQQRIRNRIYEYLELVSSFDAQRQYQTAVPWINVANEIINLWSDSVWEEDPLTYCPEPTFSSAEREAISRFHIVWNEVCEGTPQTMPPLNELFGNLLWLRLREAADEAFSVFRKRGKLSEDAETF